jgi:hypothetical protein
MFNWFDVFFALKKVIRAREELVGRAMSVGTVLTPKIVFKINKIAADVRYSGTANNAKFHPAFLAVFVFDGIKNIVEGISTLSEFFVIGACVVFEPVHSFTV